MRNLLRSIGRFREDQRGSVAIIMGVLIIPLVGILGIGFEVSNWYMVTRSMQNAADAATLAAATNGGANYDVEAKAVAAQYGFVDGTNTVSVAATNTAACPDGSGNFCYRVTITGSVPLLVSQVVGFKGDAAANGTMKLSSLAVATAGKQDVCLLALASSGVAQGIRTNGAPTGSMNGCDSLSNTGAQCNGHNLGLGISFAVGSNNGCGARQVSSPPLADPYAYLASNIPAVSSPCDGSIPSHFLPSGSLSLSAGPTVVKGDQILTGDTVINTPLGQPAVLIIENGQLDLAKHNLTSSNGSAVTIVFSGTNGTCNHTLANNGHGTGGAIDIAAPGPNSGPWSGVAIYQAPNLTSGVDVSAAGNSPTWNISGLIYMPHATITLKGAIDKSNVGKSCVVLVADNFQISGTGGILKSDVGQCAQAGLKPPAAKLGSQLVL